MRNALTWDKCERLVQFEVKRIGVVRGYDREDLLQEGRIIAAKCLERVDPSISTGVSYTKDSVRNRLISLKRNAHVAARCPQSPTGAPLFAHDVALDALPEHVADRVLECPQRSPEELAITQEATSRIRLMLGSEEAFQWLLSAATEGASLARKGAKLTQEEHQKLTLLRNAATIAIEYRVEDMKEDPMSLYAKLPVEHKLQQHGLMDCHTRGAKPVGYNQKTLVPYKCPDETTRNIPMCTICGQKYSCLTALIDTPIGQPGARSDDPKGRNARIEDDPEVAAVLAGTLGVDDAKQRLMRRTKLVLAGQPVPEELDFNAKSLGIETEPFEPEVEEADADSVVEEAEALVETTENPEVNEEPEEEYEAEEAEEEDPVEPTIEKMNGASRTHAAIKAAAAKAVAKVVKAAKLTKPAKAAKTTPKPAAKAIAKAVTKAAPKPAAKAAPKPAKAAPKAVKKAKAAPKPVAKAATKAPKAKKAKDKKTYPAGTLFTKSGKPMPTPTEIPEALMKERMHSMKLGQPNNFEFKYGMQIVRKRRVQGDEVVVVLKPHGFELHAEGKHPQIFSSLSACSTYADHRSNVSGNDFFNLARHRNTEVRDKNGKMIVNQEMCQPSR